MYFRHPLLVYLPSCDISSGNFLNKHDHLITNNVIPCNYWIFIDSPPIYQYWIPMSESPSQENTAQFSQSGPPNSLSGEHHSGIPLYNEGHSIHLGHSSRQNRLLDYNARVNLLNSLLNAHIFVKIRVFQVKHNLGEQSDPTKRHINRWHVHTRVHRRVLFVVSGTLRLVIQVVVSWGRKPVFESLSVDTSKFLDCSLSICILVQHHTLHTILPLWLWQGLSLHR